VNQQSLEFCGEYPAFQATFYLKGMSLLALPVLK